MNRKIPVFFISDSTAITAETLGKSILSQFDTVEFEHHVLPYIDSEEKAHQTVLQINELQQQYGAEPIVFDTVVNPAINQILASAKALNFDVLTTYLKPIETHLNVSSNDTVGKAHGIAADPEYQSRIQAVQFALDNDDGGKIHRYEMADLILIGVSRCGKTPTCLYLAMQFGIYAANYPITEEDMDEIVLPKALKAHRDKLFGLSIDSSRLSSIRQERKPNSRYASTSQCDFEVKSVETLYRRFGIDFINTTDVSIEEIAAKILVKAGIERK